MSRRLQLKKARRIVVKIGTALLITETGKLNLRFIAKLTADIAALKRQGKAVILVSSGAIGTGMVSARIKEKPRTIPGKQAMAAIGQPRLMHAYDKSFGRQGLLTAQILLTSEDINHRERYSHARNTLRTLLAMNVVPIFNENDTISVSEIKFGDNDELSAQVTHLANADLLIILTNVDGLFSGHPQEDPEARLIHEVEKIDGKIEAMAASKGSQLGTGGMITKLRAAKKVISMGENMVIANGKTPAVLQRIVAGEMIGTIFLSQTDKLASRKRWIAFALKPKGALVLDAGATRAILEGGKSLLPSGIRLVKGSFRIGDCVELQDEAGHGFARGLVKYTSEQVGRLCGVKSSEIERILGCKHCDEIIHRDDLTLLK